MINALEYLSKASEYRVTKQYENDSWCEQEEFSHYQIDTLDDSNLYAVVEDDGEVEYFIRGGEGYDAYDARIDVDVLRKLIEFVNIMVK